MSTNDSQTGHNSKEQLKAICERINRLEDEKKEAGKGIAEIYLEAKGNGLNPKAIRVIVRKQRADAKKAKELADDVDAYMVSLGMVD